MVRAGEGSELSLGSPDAAVLGSHFRAPAGTGGLLGGHVGTSGLRDTGVQSQLCIADQLLLLLGK